MDFFMDVSRSFALVAKKIRTYYFTYFCATSSTFWDANSLILSYSKIKLKTKKNWDILSIVFLHSIFRFHEFSLNFMGYNKILSKLQSHYNYFFPNLLKKNTATTKLYKLLPSGEIVDKIHINILPIKNLHNFCFHTVHFFK